MSWRTIAVAGIVSLALLPTLPLILLAATEDFSGSLWTHAFVSSLGSSLLIGAGVTLVSFCIGFPLGLGAGLYRFRGRSLLVAFQALPLDLYVVDGLASLQKMQEIPFVLHDPEGLLSREGVSGRKKRP